MVIYINVKSNLLQVLFIYGLIHYIVITVSLINSFLYLIKVITLNSFGRKICLNILSKKQKNEAK